MAASVADRNSRLDQLQGAVTTWAAKRTKYLKDQVATDRAILKGRTGSERLAQSSVTASKDLVVDSINDFLLT